MLSKFTAEVDEVEKTHPKMDDAKDKNLKIKLNTIHTIILN